MWKFQCGNCTFHSNFPQARSRLEEIRLPLCCTRAISKSFYSHRLYSHLFRLVYCSLLLIGASSSRSICLNDAFQRILLGWAQTFFASVGDQISNPRPLSPMGGLKREPPFVLFFFHDFPSLLFSLHSWHTSQQCSSSSSSASPLLGPPPLRFLAVRLCPCFPEAPWILHTVDILIHDAAYRCGSGSASSGRYALWAEAAACFAASADGGKIGHLIINWITGGIFGLRWSWELGSRKLVRVYALKSPLTECERDLASSALIRRCLMLNADVL